MHIHGAAARLFARRGGAGFQVHLDPGAGQVRRLHLLRWHRQGAAAPLRAAARSAPRPGPARAAATTGSPVVRTASTMTEVGWWKLTFLRKKKSTPKVLYEMPETYAQPEGGAEPPRPEAGGPSSDFSARLEKIVDKNTKGKHVKVSNSGRFKEKKKVRAMLAENPGLFDDPEDKGQ
ncbi:PREDICTED: proline-rich protein 15-like protein [Chinchilla lanigera]|nr:PREDICTED: proline-rich protein 15-like protein [Chinchilla lanigera]